MSIATPRKFRVVGLLAAAAAVVGLALPAATSAAAPSTHPKPVKPTVVLVHGAWADASSFAPVTAALQEDGYKVVSAPNPLRSLATDAAYVAAFVNQNTTGPVVLVGHSYGGSVITNAATETPRVKALVYVNAFAPDEGESAYELTGAKPGSLLNVPPADLGTVFDFVQFPGAGVDDYDAYVKPARFREIFAAGLSRDRAAVLAAGQRPITTESALKARSGAPAWKTITSYFFVGTTDKVIPPAQQLAMADRAGGVVVKAKADHLSMLEVPHKVAHLIERAAVTR
ncbi:alpha/beta hydrolase [Mumia sp. zg.B53]|uniref:alpha/beta fold hydrolase n=1 Tax=unclassified Mumia TaxID=2621872 RepID=UPI001C6EEE7F|nr:MULTISPECIES: alpha/beta hydrolase [unclassified Mumia]MBW9204965.1 alpha/beta hydrolase [Mumia sp. zg.B17]MBW9213641.1 alpha/beta hydrolase [Mumia sp. zg.B53]MDD9348737.1 alpha/beta hydrolase [Mumia sp.]